MCDKDILQLFCEDINQSMSPLNITYHYINSVTVSSSNRHPVCAGCLLSRHALLPHLDPWRWDRLFIPKRRNGITTLCCVQSQNIASRKSCSISVCPSFRRMQNGGIYIYICSVTLLQKMSTRVKSHDLPGQGIGPALFTQYLCSRFKRFFIYKNHHTGDFSFWYHINKIHTHTHTHTPTSLLWLLIYFHSLAYSCVCHL